MALRYCSIIHTVTLVIAVVGRPACIPSAMYLFLLLVSLQGSCVSWSSSGLILSAATSSAAAATFLVVSVTSVAAESVAPFPALWWPDFLVLAVSLGMLLIVARIRLVTVAPSGHADATVSRFDSTAEGSTSIVATCLLAIACALQPCFIALPLLLLVLCILHSWGWGIAAPQLIHRTQVLFKVAQVYGALWLAATYALQLALNVGVASVSITGELGIHPLPWLSATAPHCDSQWCIELIEAQCLVLLIYLFWVHHIEPKGTSAFLACLFSTPSLWRSRAHTAEGFDVLSRPLLSDPDAVGAAEPPCIDEVRTASDADHITGTSVCATLGGSASRPAVSSTTLASGSAACGALILTIFGGVSPCAVSAFLLMIGTIGLMNAAMWSYGPVRPSAAGVRHTPGAISLCALPEEYAGCRGRLVIEGTHWLCGSLSASLLWMAIQFTVASTPQLITELYSNATALTPTVDILSRAGAVPSPMLMGENNHHLSITVALLIHLVLITLLALASRLHTTEMRVLHAGAAQALETPLPASPVLSVAFSSSDEPAVIAPPRTHEGARTWQQFDDQFGHLGTWCAWHSTTLSLLLVAVEGLRTYDVVHAIYIFLYLFLTSINSHRTHTLWPLLICYSAFAALLAVLGQTFAPAQDGRKDNVLGVIGISGPTTRVAHRAVASWVQLWPTLVILLLLLCQDAIHRTSLYRRALARRRWVLARAHYAHLTNVLLQRGSASKTLVRWSSFAMLLPVALLPSARLGGLIYLAAFACLLYTEQAGERNCRRSAISCAESYLLWPIIICTLLVELVARFLVAIPYVQSRLFSATGVFGPQCALGDHIVRPTPCQRLLDDLGLAVPTTISRVQLGGLCVAFAIALRQLQSCREEQAAPTHTGSTCRPPRRSAAVGSGRSTELQYYPPVQGICKPTCHPLPTAARCTALVDAATFWAIAEYTATVALLFTAFTTALIYDDVVRAAYLVCVVMACVLGGRAVCALWMPIGLFSAAIMLIAYAFQLNVTDGWCGYNDRVWLGIDWAHDNDKAVAVLWAVYLPIVMQVLALAQRQLQLKHRNAAWQASMLQSAFSAAVAAAAAAQSGMSGRVGDGTAAGSGSGSSDARHIDSDICVENSFNRCTTDVAGSRANPDALIAEDDGHVTKTSTHALASELRHRLLRLCGELIEPLALTTLLFVAAVRLNAWALCYVVAAGALRYCRCGPAPASNCWFATRMLLAASIITQYLARISLPPSVWPRTDVEQGRPWVTWGANWSLADGECARLGHQSGPASGVVCYFAVTGVLSSWWMMADFIALLVCLLQLVTAKTTASSCALDLTQELVADFATQHSGRISSADQVMTCSDDAFTTWTSWCCTSLRSAEVWLLRLSHVIVMTAVVALAFTPNYNHTQGIFSLGYIFLSLAMLATEGRVVKRRGACWPLLVAYSWLVILAQIAFQA